MFVEGKKLFDNLRFFFQEQIKMTSLPCSVSSTEKVSSKVFNNNNNNTLNHFLLLNIHDTFLTTYSSNQRHILECEIQKPKTHVYLQGVHCPVRSVIFDRLS